jgi:hypothetical protein
MVSPQIAGALKAVRGVVGCEVADAMRGVRFGAHYFLVTLTHIKGNLVE